MNVVQQAVFLCRNEKFHRWVEQRAHYVWGVVAEKAQLEEKIVKLQMYLGTKPEIGTEVARLYRQLEVMQQYSLILSERIAAFLPEYLPCP